MTTLVSSIQKPYFTTPISRKYFITPGWINSGFGAAATVFAAVVSQAFYTVKLTVDGQTFTQPLVVNADPRRAK